MTVIRSWPNPAKPGKRGPRTKRKRLERMARRVELENDFHPQVEWDEPDPELIAMLRARRRAA